MTSSSNKIKSILVVGSTGRTGLALLRALSAQNFEVHAFARNASKLPKEEKNLCASVIEGDARNNSDVKNALIASDADAVILSVGNGDDTSKSDVRTVTAEILAQVLQDDPAFSKIRVVVLSTIGAGSSSIKFGFGLGCALSFILRHVIKDHNGQETAFLEQNDLKKRTLVVRASGLTDNKANGKVVTVGDNDKIPSGHIDRADVAKWIVDGISSGTLFGKAVNITGAK